MARTDPILIFIHIPKTGGSSMRQYFFRNFGRENVFWHGHGPLANGLLQPTAEREGIEHFDRFKLIGGHFNFGNKVIRAIRRPKIFAAVLRRPVERVVSHFEYVQRKPEHPLHSTSDLETTLRERMQFHTAETNAQCRFAAKATSARRALRTIRGERYLLGSQDRLDLVCARISEICGMPVGNVPSANVQGDGYYERHATDAALKLIEPIIAEDQKLYDEVRDEQLVTFNLD